MDSDKVTIRGAAVQIMAAFSIGCISFLTGLLFTWPSYNVANFVSNGTVLSEPMTLVHVSLLGSLMNIGTIFLTPLVGVVMNKIGRKNTMLSVGLFFVIAWTIISITKSISWILASVTIAGCGTAGQAVCVIYISEIAQDSIRGALSSIMVTFYFFGGLISYIIGGYLTYSQVVYLQLTISLLNIMMLSMLKDSPIYLLSKGREKEAAKSLAFYRQRSPDSKQVENEIAKLKILLDPRLEKIFKEEDPEVTKNLLPTAEPQKLSEWQFLKQSPSSIRAFITSLLIMSTMILMGNIPIQVYAETLFRESAPSFDPNTCSVWLAVDYNVAAVACMFIIDRLGRKTLTIFSCTSSSICTLILGTLIQFNWAPEWFTVLVMFVYVFFFSIGIGVIPFVLIGELFLPEVRSLGGSITLSIGYGLNFIVTLIFNPVMDNYGFAPLFYGFTIVGFTGAIYSIFYLPETKGLSVDVIQGLFLKKSKKKVDA